MIEAGIIVQPTKTGISPNLTGGTQSCGTGYCNFNGVEVFRDDGIVQAYFYANYEIVNGAADSIQSVYSDIITVRGGTFSNDSLRIVIPQESIAGGYDAQAELSFNWSFFSGSSSGIDRLDLYVGNDMAYQNASW